MAQGRRGATAKLSLAVACVVLAASGCKVGPDFRRPASPLAEHWIGEPPGSAAEPADLADWWTLFHDATLDAGNARGSRKVAPSLSQGKTR